MNIFNKNPKPITAQMLTDITRGLQHAASVTNQAATQHHLSIIDRFFEKNADGKLVAKQSILKIDEDHEIHVPLITLINPTGLMLKEMKVKLSVRIDEQSMKAIKNNLENDFEQSRSAFNVSVKSNNDKSNKNQIMDISLTFKDNHTPEGIHRIIEEYSRLIHPISNQPTTNKEENKNENQ